MSEAIRSHTFCGHAFPHACWEPRVFFTAQRGVLTLPTCAKLTDRNTIKDVRAHRVAVIGGRWNKRAQSAFLPMAETAAVSA